jgi:N-acetylglutamate synthase/N-acetylornithine aminotransferase
MSLVACLWEMQVEGGVTSVKGFYVAIIYGGLRANGKKPDLALVACDIDATVAGLNVISSSFP